MARAAPGRRGLALPARVRSLVLAACAVLATAPAPAQTLASIPLLATAMPQPLPAGAALRVRAQVQDAAGLAQMLGLRDAVAAEGGTLELTLLPAAHAVIESAADPLAASFIVDHDDPAVARLAEQLRAGLGAAAVDGAAVTAFVARVMQGELSANASLASQVARTLKGDCTEYALLTAALARRAGIGARLVFGVALTPFDGRWQAIGHAWVHMQEGGRWVVRDSALAGHPGPVYYLPAHLVSDEGPGHALGMLQGFMRMPGRVELLGIAPPLAGGG